MKKLNSVSFTNVLFLIVWCANVAADSPLPAPPLAGQPTLDDNGNITVDGELVLSTPDLSEGSYTYLDSVKLDATGLFELRTDLSGGLKGTINQPDGYILLEVFLIDNDQNKRLIYKVKLTEDSSHYYSTGTPETLTRSWDGDDKVYRVANDDIKGLLQFATPYHLEKERMRRGPWLALIGALGGGLTGYGGTLVVAGVVTAAVGPEAGVAVLKYAKWAALSGAALGAIIGSNIPDPDIFNPGHPGTVQLNKKPPILVTPGLGQDPPYDAVPDRSSIFPVLQPAIVKLTVNKSTFQGAKIPGIGEIKPSDFFLQLKVLVNDQYVYSSAMLPQNAVNGYADISPLNIDLTDQGDLTMGDKIAFEISPPFTAIPQILGIPDVWVARSAGDLMYYCTPSVVPDDIKPFLGYDTRVHNLMLRQHPGHFTPTYDRLMFDKRNHLFQWSWILKRRMDATKTTYVHSYDWPKTQRLAKNNPITLLDGTTSRIQRRNQKEGLNMQYLTYWPDWETSKFQKYTGTKYMLGFDDDELAIFGTKYPNPHDDPSYLSSAINILKLERLPWKETPEGPQIYNEQTGYPESGFVMNEMVTAYKKHHNFNDTRKYNGYEIQDNGTSDNFPDGQGSTQGNNTAPGHISIQVLKKPIYISLNVSAPFSEDRGFYGSIKGTRWPSYGEEGVVYTLYGLQDLDMDEIDKFSMEYEYEDKLGILRRETKHLRYALTTEKRDIINLGYWPVAFNMHLPSYASITAYYQREPSSERVMVAGKELKPIFLLFTGVQTTRNRPDLEGNLDFLEGRGTGSKIWLEDFRNRKYGDYTDARRFGNSTRYTKRYTKEYVFNVGDRTTFVTFDGDPHTFASDDQEWYLGSRYMARRVTDDYLDGSRFSDDSAPSWEHAYLNYYIEKLDNRSVSEVQDTGRSGKEFTKTWNNAGVYEMRVSYRSASELHYKITVVNYGNTDDGIPVKGRIVQRHLTQKERNFLGVTNVNAQVAEVVDIYSRYAYVDGPRATVPKENRWAKQRDFDSKFEWTSVDGNGVESLFETGYTEVNTFLSNYSYDGWFWNNWAHHYSSNWLRPAASDRGQGLPSGLLPGDIDRIYDEKTELNPYNIYIDNTLFTPTPPANWQYTIPLVSMTENQGPRMRTNPSSVYDLDAVFDPDTGAFSGNPALPPGAESIQAPNISDDDKDKLELYYKLRNKQMILFSSTYHSISDFIVFNSDSNVPAGKTFIARGVERQRGGH